ncbi:MAG TPA: hypothetical protein VGE12_17635 [Noviherbaspirillum sp.]
MSHATDVEHSLHRDIPLSIAMVVAVDSSSREGRVVILPAF